MKHCRICHATKRLFSLITAWEKSIILITFDLMQWVAVYVSSHFTVEDQKEW